jgi:hypothetical protein
VLSVKVLDVYPEAQSSRLPLEPGYFWDFQGLVQNTNSGGPKEEMSSCLSQSRVPGFAVKDTRHS